MPSANKLHIDNSTALYLSIQSFIFFNLEEVQGVEKKYKQNFDFLTNRYDESLRNHCKCLVDYIINLSTLFLILII